MLGTNFVVVVSVIVGFVVDGTAFRVVVCLHLGSKDPG